MTVAGSDAGSLSDRCGVQPGDTLLRVLPDGQNVHSERQLANVLRPYRLDEFEGFEVQRHGSVQYLELGAVTEPLESRSVEDSMITTLESLPGYRLIRTLGVVSAIDSNAGFSARTKGRGAFSGTFNQLLEQAWSMVRNAVLGLSISSFGAGGGSTNVLGGDSVGMTVYRTAAIVEPAGSGIE